MSEIITEIVVALDRSGSMGSIADDTVGGFNAFVQEQKEASGKAFMTLAQFDNHYEMVHERIPIEEVPSLDFKPRGGTALLDAVGKTINDTKTRIAAQRQKPDAVIFVIITDGHENSSSEFKKEQIKEMIANRESEDEWKFIFIGANQDSFSEAGGIGIAGTGVFNYEATSAGTRGMYDALSKGTTQYRSSVSSASSSSTSSSSSSSERDKKMKEYKKNLNTKNFFDTNNLPKDW
jgi:hypothetical protein